MKIGLIYFSGTGSTARFADAIAEGIRKSNHDVECLRLDKLGSKDLSVFDILGFGCPTYSFRAPRLVTMLMSQLLIPPKPIFLFLTCGGMPGTTLWSMYKIIQKQQPDGIYLGDVMGFGPNNLRAWRPKLSKSVSEYNSLLQEDIDAAEIFGEQLTSRYQAIRAGTMQTPSPPKLNPLWGLYTTFFTSRWEMRSIVGKKFVETEKCTQCQLCATKICPAGAISMTVENYPTFDEKKCVGCNGCVCLCPMIAINSRITRNRHPYTTYRKWVLNFP